METDKEYSTKIPFREKVRLLLEGAGTIVGVPVSEPARREIVIGKTTRDDLSSESDIEISSGGASIFSPDTDLNAVQELLDEIRQHPKSSGV